MAIIGIYAKSKNGVIGRGGQLPWHVPGDLAHFRRVTEGHAIVMGRSTFDGLGGRLLPNRVSVVLTTSPETLSESDNLKVFTSKEAILDWYLTSCSSDLYIIGGKHVLEYFASNLDMVVETTIETDFDGDTYAPELDFSRFSLVSESYNEAEIPYTVRVFER